MSTRSVFSSGRTRAKTATIEFPIVQASPLLSRREVWNSTGHSRTAQNLANEEPCDYTLKTKYGPDPFKTPHQMQHQRFPLPINPKLRKLKPSKSARRAEYLHTGNASYYVNTTPIRHEHDSPSKLYNEPNASSALPASIASANSRIAAGIEAIPEANTVSQNYDEEMMSPMADTLHMDLAGLKQFPILGPNDRHVRFLSLQHNSISRLQNLIVLNNLIVLDLYNNKIERISGLQSFHNLRVLLLGKNRIRRMEGLEVLRKLEILDLHGNQLRYLDNLTALDSLRILNVAGNVIRSIRNFGPSNFGSLHELNMKRNRLRNLNGLEKAVNLKKLFISNNELQSTLALNPLRNLTCLDEILLDSNPMCSIPDYQNSVLSILPMLRILDRTMINDEMRNEAKIWLEKRNYPAADDLTSLNENVFSQTEIEGLTTSRDAIINRARKRWESVIKFVKNRSEAIGRDNSKSIYENCIADTIQSGLSSKFEATEAQSGSVPQTSVFEINLDTEEQSNLIQLTPQTSVHMPNSCQGPSIKQSSSSSKSTKVAIVRPRLRSHDENADAPDCLPVINSNNSLMYKNTDRQFCTSLVANDAEFQSIPFSAKSGSMSVLNESSMPEHGHSFTETYLSTSCERGGNEALTVDLELNTSRSVPSSLNSLANITRSYEPEQSNLKNCIDRKKAPAIQRSSSVDASLQCVADTEGVGTGSLTNIAAALTSSRRRRNSASLYRNVLSRKSSKLQGQQSKVPAPLSPNLSGNRRPMTGIREREVTSARPLTHVNSLSKIVGSEQTPSETLKKQGPDYLIEIESKTLCVFGQGALKHFLTWFPEAAAERVETIKFHFINYDTIIPCFGKLRQVYPSAENFHFRANNISILAHINAMAGLQGLNALVIHPDGNPITENLFWEAYAMYRLGHWGLKEVSSDYGGRRVKGIDEDLKIFESLGYLALSCLPQNTLTPLATKLHALQTFCCCSQSSSSEDSARKKYEGSESSEAICNAWDNDPVLLDVIGKEALVYNSTPNDTDSTCSSSAEGIASRVVKIGCEMLDKLEELEQALPEIVPKAIEDILNDFYALENHMKKEFKQVKKDVCFNTN